jgi:Ca2+-binding RTX toxin-like protein
MAQYRYDPIWNTYVLEDAENFSLVDGQDHTDPNAGVTGNAFDNTIIGNDADNRLDGGEGADTLEGGSGNDAYAVDNPGDVVIEAEGGGSGDSVTAYISYTLPDHVEVLILQGFENIRGTGTGLANTLLGSDGGNNLLQGLGGNDRLFGFDGDDTLDGGEGADERTAARTWSSLRSATP